jgi:hypothetical protein
VSEVAQFWMAVKTLHIELPLASEQALRVDRMQPFLCFATSSSLPAIQGQRSEDKDPTHTIARISFSDLEDDEAILSDVVIFASISICH